MTDNLKNQQMYEKELARRQGLANWQCAVIVWCMFGFFNSLIYFFGG